MAYEFKIGATAGTMVTLLSLGVPAPKYEYSVYSGEITLGDGTARGVGLPMTAWHWGFLTSTQRASLRTYCTGKSSIVYIRTIIDDGTYANFQAVMIWANQEERQDGRIIDFTLAFRNMVEQ